MKNGFRNAYKTSHEHLLLPCSDCIMEICEISRRQEQSAKVNAFLYIVTPIPTTSAISQA